MGCGEYNCESIAERVRQYIEGHEGMSQEKFAKLAGMSGGTLSMFLKNQCKGNVERTAKRILAVLEAEENRDFAQTTVREPEIVRTSVMAKIWTGLLYANSRNDIIVIYGYPGLGKTCALKKWANEHASSLFITASPNIKTGRDIMEEILEAMSRKAEGRNKLLEKNIIRALRGTNRAIIIDEAHFLWLDGLETLRRIYDATQCPVILAGNNKIMDMITERNKSITGQFFSRAVRIALEPKIEMEDVEKIVLQNGVDLDDECLEELYRVANEIGSLRVMTKLFLFAWTLANDEESPITIEHIRQAKGVIISV